MWASVATDAGYGNDAGFPEEITAPGLHRHGGIQFSAANGHVAGYSDAMNGSGIDWSRWSSRLVCQRNLPSFRRANCADQT
jgi:hypothetical protein